MHAPPVMAHVWPATHADARDAADGQGLLRREAALDPDAPLGDSVIGPGCDHPGEDPDPH